MVVGIMHSLFDIPDFLNGWIAATQFCFVDYEFIEKAA
jgi:hypothetical protein